jgi:aspartate kinase
MVKVVKFGGSSLASASQFMKVKSIITSDKARNYVVPSAPGKRFSDDTKVTDMLYGCYALAEEDKDFSEELKAIQARYNEIIAGLSLNTDLSSEFDTITENFKNKAGRDYAASRGEYLNGIIMADYLGYTFVDAAKYVYFDEAGNFLSEETNTALSEYLATVPKAVIPGFYGSILATGQVKTFSRGGSDITGSIVARAINADIYENWTDVSGVLIVDPRIVKGALPIEVVTYKELRELSYMGASVLHEDAIFPVRKAGIPINIKNTNAPDDPGTLIVENTCKNSKHIITGIAGKKGFCSVNIEKDMMNSEIGFGRRVLQAFEDNGISFEHMPSGIDTLTVFVHQSEFEAKEQLVLNELQKLTNPDSIDLESNLALIAVVGRGMKSMRGTAGKIFSALTEHNINIRMIDQGSSELNIIIGVADEDFELAIQAIYATFVNEEE